MMFWWLQRWRDPSKAPAGRGPGRIVKILSTPYDDANEPGPFGIASAKSGFDTFATLKEASTVARQRSEADPGTRVFVYFLHGWALAKVPPKPESEFKHATLKSELQNGPPEPGNIAF